jgi:hypothetical protein
MPERERRNAEFLEVLDESGVRIGDIRPIDVSLLVKDYGVPFAWGDGWYQTVGHVGNFVFAIQRIRKVPVETEAPSSTDFAAAFPAEKPA